MTSRPELDEELLTVSEAAKRFKLHPDTLYDWCRKGVVQHIRVGPGTGRIRLRPIDLRRTVTTADRRRR